MDYVTVGFAGFLGGVLACAVMSILADWAADKSIAQQLMADYEGKRREQEQARLGDKVGHGMAERG